MQPVNIAVVARMFDMKPESLQYWYKNFISGYNPDIAEGRWHPAKIESAARTTGELTGKPVYIFKKENIGGKMSIDDKAIGRDGFTIFSNNETGRIALLVESTNAEEVEAAIGLFGNELQKVKHISMDMSPAYSLVADNLMPRAAQVVDKYHVMKYVYDAVSDVRIKIKKTLASSLSKGKKKTEEDRQILGKLELVKRVQHALTQSPEKWNEDMQYTINQVFDSHEELKTAYHVSQHFKQWYNYQNHTKTTGEITRNLYKWYEQAKEIKEFESVVKMIRKHEDEILNFFLHGMTNASAERLNGKIQRFVSNNYGIKDKDFILYRMAGYFS